MHSCCSYKTSCSLHYGGQIAAPVFREIAIKLYAMYIEQKTGPAYQVTKDSLNYFYAGNSSDIKNVFKTLNVDYSDSVDDQIGEM
jgi:hypothetical protein